ncbi:hypothetical protein BKP45_13480 [Anaerobacillus alkalidiazotrophicus]|uniref:Phage protein n=1 Tax=Anaerobacillus alkalidiazotrophicus TaxID=472963 RepID=A0A1S2M4N0_9BACI|nr:hypothetical protein [Anaerobacillus alkalidiazotrophicus]OIJ19450.1 hypothetical protein BKP45_13480 [Anaerobacillus alkalidiazotrophicus]
MRKFLINIDHKPFEEFETVEEANQYYDSLVERHENVYDDFCILDSMELVEIATFNQDEKVKHRLSTVY